MSNARRKFIGEAGMALIGTAIVSSMNTPESEASFKEMFVHHVYFWLNNPNSQEDLEKLLTGLRKLSKVKSINKFHMGKPAGTNREVIDSSYQVSWLLMFKTRADQDNYQVDPIHLQFVEDCKHLWKKVLVYDSVEI